MSEQSVEKIDLDEKFGQFAERWSPKIVGRLNDTHVKVVKLQGEFVWHHHEVEDELFLVVRGAMRLHLRDRTIDLAPGQMVIVPAGVEHMPACDEETWVVLIEPVGTLNTGNVTSDRTVHELERI
jgi:mannose-6-phosphate isomerase-like protein (cupin superfamily)